MIYLCIYLPTSLSAHLCILCHVQCLPPNNDLANTFHNSLLNLNNKLMCYILYHLHFTCEENKVKHRAQEQTAIK